MRKILVMGATGFVGSRLVARLMEKGFSVRAAGRSRHKLEKRLGSGRNNLELVEADVLDAVSLGKALQGVDTAFYLVHSMNPQNPDFAGADRKAAGNMARLSGECGVKKIIYLSGLGEEGEGLSKHLRSRHEVEEILRSGTVPVTVLRAAMIIGAGSASFEIMRHLVNRLPVMITPRWVSTPSQPIAVDNVIHYLCGCIDREQTWGQTYDIGGDDIVSYRDLMRVYAEEAGLRKRFVIPVPVLTPWLSALWIHLVTPMPSYIARPLAEGLRNPVICQDRRITEVIRQDLLDCREAIRRALNDIHNKER